METIGSILERVRANLQVTTTTVTEEPPSDPCPVCEDRRFVKIPDLPIGHPDFGQAVPCDACRPSSESFFEGLKVDQHNRKAIAEGWAMVLDPKGWLILKGDRGTGKSTVAQAILSARNRRESIPMAAAALLDYWRSRIGEEDFAEVFARDCASPFFVLDDLAAIRPVEPGRGDGTTTPWALERLTVFLDHRYSRRLPTVITTDKGEVEMSQIVGPRIADRVFDRGTGLCTVIPMTGPSRRTGREW